MSAAFRFSFVPLALSASALLASCSQSTPATTATSPDGAAPEALTQFPFGAKVDSLNGLAGHTFGQSLSAFPKMEMYPPEAGELTRTYHLPKGPASGWFAKHYQQVPYQYYSFLDEQFCRFRVVGNPVTLRAEALYLLGAGQEQGPQIFWEGSRARAVYSEQARGLDREGTLDVLSKPLEAAQAAKAQAKLKAENAQ
ncbi:MAG: hypothetical protein ACRYFX_18060 [Janthinobacterium lividum]